MWNIVKPMLLDILRARATWKSWKRSDDFPDVRLLQNMYKNLVLELFEKWNCSALFSKTF